MFPLAGLLGLIWFLVRVVPKPSRAAYPCQRVALPAALGFVVWLAAGLGVVTLARKIRLLLRGARLERTLGWLGLGLMTAIFALFHIPPRPVVADSGQPPNEPIGVARGIYPGRVVWVHDPNATDWEGTNDQGQDIGDGYWWQAQNTDQAVVDRMLGQAVRSLSGQDTNAAAWDALFRYFNVEHGNGDVGYQPGEKIMVKVNLVTTQFGMNDYTGAQTSHLAFVDTSPQMIVALLRQLVHVVGVSPSDISVGDPWDFVPNHIWDYCHSEFPDVRYIQRITAWGRYQSTPSQGTPYEKRIYWSTSDAVGKEPDYVPLDYTEAAYMINFACLKGHSAGVTLCAKNHYGSLGRSPTTPGYYSLHVSLSRERPGMGHYRAHVDIIGNSALGGNTLLYLIDGLYAGYYWDGHPYKWALPPFGDGHGGTDWPSSLFASLDPVAIDSVAYDFLLAEWPRVVTGGEGPMGSLLGGEEDYLHEAALADAPPSGTFYDPDGTAAGLPSLGVHEHWNNPNAKQYTRNLGNGDGIELIAVNAGPPEPGPDGDLDGDGDVDLADLAALLGAYGTCVGDPFYNPNADLDESGCVDLADLATLLGNYGYSPW